MSGEEATMASNSADNLFTHTFFYSTTQSDDTRNYTVCYDKEALTTLWVAYPLSSNHINGSYKDSSWSYVDESLLPQSNQVNIVGGSYKSTYSRGHLVPNASRTKSSEMNKQAFYTVNSVPQIQDKFNSGVWSALENALRSRVSSDGTLYIVTGTMCDQVNDGNGNFSPVSTKDQNDKTVPAPRYFYKVVLKVDNANNPTSASAIGFWYTNEAHTSNYNDANYVKSIDQIEAWTGLNFFVNLPDTIENDAEKMTTPWW